MPRRPPDAAPQPIALHKLPGQLRMLVRIMGEAAAFKLAEHRGGTPITVPLTLHRAAERGLLELVGADAFAALVAELPGQTLQLPKYDSVLRQLRHQRVLAWRAQGNTQAVVALATGYTVRQVINILNRNGVAQVDVQALAQRDFFADAHPAPAPPTKGAAVARAHNPFGLPPQPTGADPAKRL